MGGPLIYDLLAQQEISELTIANLNKAAKNTAIASKNIDFWSGIITVARAMEESRTYAHGLVIPETGDVLGNEIDDGANETFIPTGTEVWAIQNLDLQGCTAALREVSSGQMSQLTDTTFKAGTIYLSASLALFFSNASGSPKTPTFAYYKVSL
tara:strand:+ start:298 stop:759 length:462 start_codon:yes stop_codon:yes gene_type:complete